jgi:hypothetical protein
LFPVPPPPDPPAPAPAAGDETKPYLAAVTVDTYGIRQQGRAYALSQRAKWGGIFLKKFISLLLHSVVLRGGGKQAELQKKKGAAQTAAASGSACERGWRPRLLLSLCCGYKTGTILSHQQPQSVLSWRHRFKKIIKIRQFCENVKTGSL